MFIECRKKGEGREKGKKKEEEKKMYKINIY